VKNKEPHGGGKPWRGGVLGVVIYPTAAIRSDFSYRSCRGGKYF